MAFKINFRSILPKYISGCLWYPLNDNDVFSAFCQNKYEINELRFMRSFLKPSNIFLDIGANFGLYSILAAKIVGKKGQVIAIEPDPTNVINLKKNIFLNQLPIKILNCALGEKDEEVEYLCCSEGAYSGLKIAKVPGHIKKIMVHKKTLDDLIIDLGLERIDLIKIDVEGAELLVLHGGETTTFKKIRPVLLMEFSDRRTIAFGYSCSELIIWAKKNDYSLFNFTSSGKLTAHREKSYYDYDNLVGCPQEKIHLLSNYCN